jgi:hypothetical protein
MSNIASASPARGPHLASAGRGADYIKNGYHDAILHTATGLLIWDGSQQPTTIASNDAGFPAATTWTASSAVSSASLAREATAGE